MGWKQPARASLDWPVSAARGMNISVRPKPGKKAVIKVVPALQERAQNWTGLHWREMTHRGGQRALPQSCPPSLALKRASRGSKEAFNPTSALLMGC